MSHWMLVLARERARERAYVVTVHAEEEMSEDGYTILDVEQGILSGAILEHQLDAHTGERKYRIRGTTMSGRSIEEVVKLSPTGRLVIITVYEP